MRNVHYSSHCGSWYAHLVYVERITVPHAHFLRVACPVRHGAGGQDDGESLALHDPMNHCLAGEAVILATGMSQRRWVVHTNVNRGEVPVEYCRHVALDPGCSGGAGVTVGFFQAWFVMLAPHMIRIGVLVHFPGVAFLLMTLHMQVKQLENL